MAVIAEALKPSELGLDLEGDEFRPGQLETAVKVVTSGKRYVLVDAPTGSGKTAIALAIAALVDRQLGKTFITTSTKDLQDQYLKDGEGLGLVKVMGRNNFVCHIDRSVQASQGKCVYHVPCEYAGTGDNSVEGCGYYDQLREALAAPVVIFNCAYFLAERQYTKRFEKPSILICDEAHDLRNQISAAVTLDARKGTFDHAKLDWPDKGDDLLAWIEWAVENEQKVNELVKHLTSSDLEPQARTQLRAAQSIQNVIEQLQLPAQYVAKIMSNEHIQFLPVWPAPFAKRLLLNAADKIVFMTATPGDPKTFAASLGIDLKDLEVIQLPSTFHKSRRPLRYWPQGRIAGNDPDTWRSLIPAINHILDQNPEDKGLICCVSYRLGAFLARELKSKYGSRILFPDPTERTKKLKEFRESNEPLVMISPSMSMGVDLPFDQCRFVVVPKLPFVDRSDPVQKARSTTKLGKALSLTDTALNLVQSYGRAMRDEKDWGVTWLLDGNFDWFEGAAHANFPYWFLEAITTYKEKE